MKLLLLDFLHSDNGWTAESFVIIANVPDEATLEIRETPELSKVQFIQADYFSENALRAGKIETAGKVIVLADWWNRTESATETDAKTVMAAMTIEKIAPHVHMIVEILDPSFVPYLKMAHVDEIIYSKEYSRILLANLVSSAGLAHVVHELLDVSGHFEIKTLAIPEDIIGKTFLDLYNHYDSKPELGAVCIGLLENTGNIHDLKKVALIEAQKCLEIKTVLRNLSQVKAIETNLPQLNPQSDYLIGAHCMAVVVARIQRGKAS